eukprot:gene58016-biopygen40722
MARRAVPLLPAALHYRAKSLTAVSAPPCAPSATDPHADAELDRHDKPFRWWGAAAVGDAVYFCPSTGDSVLRLDTGKLGTGSSSTTTLIPTGQTGNLKWAGAAAVGTTVYCAPFNSEHILAVDTSTQRTALVEGEYM